MSPNPAYSTTSQRDFEMFPPPEISVRKTRRRPHARKKPENHIPRSPNAFILFRSWFVKNGHVPTGVETNHSTLSTIIGLTWSSMPEKERQHWHLKAKEAQQEHKRRFPTYVYRPRKASSSTGKSRKVREVQPRDTKRCAKIAQLLVDGKSGSELDAAIQEFDKTHVLEIVTRFEPPVTASAYHHLHGERDDNETDSDSLSSSSPISDGDVVNPSANIYQCLPFDDTSPEINLFPEDSLTFGDYSTNPTSDLLPDATGSNSMLLYDLTFPPPSDFDPNYHFKLKTLQDDNMLDYTSLPPLDTTCFDDLPDTFDPTFPTPLGNIGFSEPYLYGSPNDYQFTFDPDLPIPSPSDLDFSAFYI